MKTAKFSLYFIAAILILSSFWSLFGLAAKFAIGNTNLLNAEIIITLILNIGFLIVAYSTLTNPVKRNELTQLLNKPAIEILNKKLPIWLLIYAFILVGVMVYYELFEGGF